MSEHVIMLRIGETLRRIKEAEQRRVWAEAVIDGSFQG